MRTATTRALISAIAVTIMAANVGRSHAGTLSMSAPVIAVAAPSEVINVRHRGGQKARIAGRTLGRSVGTTQYYFPPPSGYAPYPAFPYYYPPFYAPALYPDDRYGKRLRRVD